MGTLHLTSSIMYLQPLKASSLWPLVATTITEVEGPLIYTLGDIERNGVLIDSEKLNQQSKELEAKILELESKVIRPKTFSE